MTCSWVVVIVAVMGVVMAATVCVAMLEKLSIKIQRGHT
jgi:hypothetical protein